MPLDPDAKKTALRMITYGAAIATATESGQAVGATVTWLSQASFEPPMITVALKRDSRLGNAVQAAGTLALSFLHEGQAATAGTFFKAQEVAADAAEMGGEAVSPGAETGAPILESAPSWIECKVIDRFEQPDHPVVLCEVIAAGARDADAKPLELRPNGWNYGG
ncbi:MAG: flavin reductase family protein [Planctomycetota bacterium]